MLLQLISWIPSYRLLNLEPWLLPDATSHVSLEFLYASDGPLFEFYEYDLHETENRLYDSDFIDL
jgi:hypothetical protein